MAIEGFYGENCKVNCRNNSNFYKAIKPFMGKNAQNSDSIQLLENDRLVTDAVQVANVFNDFYVGKYHKTHWVTHIRQIRLVRFRICT